ncbi:hypothetical protein DYB36_011544, partial [Aphanomyces astaci]
MTPTPPPPSMPATIALPDVIIIDPNTDDAVIPEVTSDQLRATTPSDVSTASSESGGPNAVELIVIVAGILVGIGLLLGAAWFVRRRQQDNEDDEDFYDSFSEKGAQSHPSMTVEDSRYAANFAGDFGASTPQVEKDSKFFTWRSLSPKIQAPSFTSLMPPCEDDAAQMMVMRTPSDELVLHNDVPNNFRTGEQKSEPETPPTAEKTSAKDAPSASFLPSSLALVGLSVAMVVAAVTMHALGGIDPPTHQAVQEQLFRDAMQSPRNSRGNLTLANATSAPNYGSLSKYETDIVAMDDQFFLEPRECTGTMPTVLSSSWVHVLDVMQLPVGTLRSNQSIFVMRNGANHGLHFFWDGDGDCLHVLARTAGLALGIPALRLDNGVRLSSQYSLPLTTSSDVEAANRIVH